MSGDVQERLKAARERQAKREEEAKAALELRELEVLELTDKLEKELGGKPGEAFEVIDTAEGIVAVKIPDAATHKRFTEAKLTAQGIQSIEDQAMFVAACVVHPSKDAFLAMASKRPTIFTRCAGALVALSGAKEATARSKY